jgi:hypothetical protein
MLGISDEGSGISNYEIFNVEIKTSSMPRLTIRQFANTQIRNWSDG